MGARGRGSERDQHERNGVYGRSAGRGGRFAAVPPPPPSQGRGRSGAPPGGRGRSPGAAGSPYFCGRGPSPLTAQSDQQEISYRKRPGSFSPGAANSSHSRPGYPGGSPGVNMSQGLGGGKVFGRGGEAVAYDKDKEKGLWKVGPPVGQRFSAAWLRGLSAFVAWKQQAPQQQHSPAPHAPAGLAASPQPQRPACETTGSSAAGDMQCQQQQRVQEDSDFQLAADDWPGSSAASPVATAAGDGGISQVVACSSTTCAAVVDTDSYAQDAGSTTVEDAVAAGLTQLHLEHPRSRVARSNSSNSTGSDMGWAAVLSQAVNISSATPNDQSASGSNSDTSPAPAASSPPCQEQGGGFSPCRPWWPASDAAQLSPEPVSVECRIAGQSRREDMPPVQLSLRLEKMGLTDREAHMLADWCCHEAASVAAIRKLWLFDNRLSDEGAVAVARILSQHPDMLEVHLSHNMLTLRGASSLIEALRAAPATAGDGAGASTASHKPSHEHAVDQAHVQGPAVDATSDVSGSVPLVTASGMRRAVWLRLEWNRISLEGLMPVLQEQHERRGLVVDLPAAVRPDAAPALPDLPAYLSVAAAVAPTAPAGAPPRRGPRNALQFLVEHCHARLPWVSCQYQLPSEAEVLKAARRGWSQQPPPPSTASNAAEIAVSDASEAGAPTPAALPSNVSSGGGPLLLFPDTSALLPMLGAHAQVATPTHLTLEMMGSLAARQRFGRSLPAHEQVFVVVTDSVLKQLDGLKNDPAARAAVRRFLSQGLDAYGPAGADFLTVLGAHEGEGLVVEHDAAVAGSRSADVSTKGQRADHRIVEVALFFQREVMRGSLTAPSPTAGGAEGAEHCLPASADGSPPLSASCFPVLLLSGDNAQVQTARSHGLPAARMADVAATRGRIEAALQQQQPLTASLLRSCLGAAAITGLAEQVAVRNLQAEFDDAIAALEAAAEALDSSQQQLAAIAAALAPGAMCGSEAVLAAHQLLVPVAGKATPQVVLKVLHARLPEWRQLVRSHQDPSRLHRWATTGT